LTWANTVDVELDLYYHNMTRINFLSLPMAIAIAIAIAYARIPNLPTSLPLLHYLTCHVPIAHGVHRPVYRGYSEQSRTVWRAHSHARKRSRPRP
jgi:hypothetical protein